jgi:hypothetical protein
MHDGDGEVAGKEECLALVQDIRPHVLKLDLRKPLTEKFLRTNVVISVWFSCCSLP